MEALITQTRRLRGEVDAVRRDAAADEDDALRRWQRALCDLAVHQLDDLGGHLDQLRAGRPAGAPAEAEADDATAPTSGALTGRVGSAEWNLLTDEVSWSDELFDILDRPRAGGPMTLDELPSLVFAEDRALLASMVTGCLVDGRPVDGEFRVVRHGGQVRTVHMMGEPVLDGTRLHGVHVGGRAGRQRPARGERAVGRPGTRSPASPAPRGPANARAPPARCPGGAQPSPAVPYGCGAAARRARRRGALPAGRGGPAARRRLVRRVRTAGR